MTQTIRASDVRAATEAYFGREPGTLVRPGGPRDQCAEKHIGMYLAYELTDKSNVSVARAFGVRHHTTTIHARQRVARSLEHPIVRKALTDIRRIMLNGELEGENP